MRGYRHICVDACIYIFLTAQVNDFAHMRLYLMVAAVIASLSNKLFYAKCWNRNSH